MDTQDGRERAKPVDLAAFRNNKRRSRVATKITSLHIDINDVDGVSFPPLRVDPAHTLALLKMCLSVSSYLLEFYAGRH